MLLLTSVLIIIDQLTKIIVSFIGNFSDNFITLEVTYNTGIAFGFNEGNIKNIILQLFVLGIIGFFIYNQREKIDNKTGKALALMIAGGFSNMIDRIFRGGVFDFIKIGNFPNFNFADICVVVGWIYFVILLIGYSAYDQSYNLKNKR